MTERREVHEPDRIASRRVRWIALGSVVVFFLSLGIALWLMPHTPERRASAPVREDGRGLAQLEKDRALVDRDIDRAMDRLLADPPAVDAGVEP